jgi:hypothetical protein
MSFGSRPLPQWRAEALVEIDIESNRETARGRAETAQSTLDVIVHSDASGLEGHYSPS